MIASILLLAGHLDVHVANEEWFSRYHLTGPLVLNMTTAEAPFSHRDIRSDDNILRDGFQDRSLRIALTSDIDGRVTVYEGCVWRKLPPDVRQRKMVADCLYDLGQVTE